MSHILLFVTLCTVERRIFSDTNLLLSLFFILFLIVFYFMIIVYYRYVYMAAPDSC